MEESDLQYYINLAAKLRIHIVNSTNSSNSGHPTSCSSLVEIFAILFFHEKGMKYFPMDPQNMNNEKLILSKGHAAPLLYAVWAEAGLFPVEDLKSLRKLDSNLEGHPTPRLSFVDIATGSLGQGLSAACGIGYALKYYEHSDSKVYTILGDGECAEGSVWEALNFGSFYGLSNLVAIVDINVYGQSSETMLADKFHLYINRFQAFGWKTILINGHNFEEIISSLSLSRLSNVPVAILAKTTKGKDFPEIENNKNWHGKVLGHLYSSTIAYLESKIVPCPSIIFKNFPEENHQNHKSNQKFSISLPAFDSNLLFSTRFAFGKGLENLGSDLRIVCLDGDTRASTMSQFFYEKYPERFIECFIAEQNMVGVGLGLSKRGKVPFVCAFSAFLTRSFDFIRICGLSYGNLKFIGSHSGVSVGEDGASQMGLEDLAMFRSIPSCLVLYPCDAISAYYAVQLAANYKGIAYIRTSRPAVPVVYSIDHRFECKSYVLKKSKNDRICVVGAGVTLHEALKASKELFQIGIGIRVVDIFCVMPLDVNTLISNATKAGNIIITVEDHYLAGGIFESVCSGLSHTGIIVHGLYVKEIPHSGTFQELIEKYEIDAKAISNKIKQLLEAS
jgi:transketolase